MSANKESSLLEDLPMELKPGDLRGYMLRAFEVAVAGAENDSNPDTRLKFLAAINNLYLNISVKDYADESTDKNIRSRREELAEIKRLRSDKKPWDEPEK